MPPACRYDQAKLPLPAHALSGLGSVAARLLDRQVGQFCAGLSRFRLFLVFAMLTLALTLNLLIVLLCWYGVKQLNRARAQLTDLADRLVLAEQQTAELLRQSPQRLAQGQQSLQRYRSQYQQLQAQLQQLRQLLSLVGLGWSIWQRQQSVPSRARVQSGSAGSGAKPPLSR